MRALHDPEPVPLPGPGVAPTSPQPLSVLLVEDDRADALLVEELIADAAVDIRLVWAHSVADAEREIARARPDCVLLDLNLPDASGIDALDHICDCDATLAIVVLTGLFDEHFDEHFGVSAVASGAQDYLVKGRVEPDMLRRSLLYAIERKRAELTAVDLHASQIRARENARLERGLLPSPLLLDNPGVEIVAQYRPSRENALLGGDFYDFIQTPDRTVHVMIGDVAGHGPDEAALGVALRIAWRTLTFAGLRGSDRMRQLERILHAERAGKGIFATVLSLAIPPDSSRITAVRAGHPGMLLHVGAPSNGSSRRVGRHWACTPATGRHSRWNGPKARGSSCSPTASSRAMPAAVMNASASRVCLSWPAHWRHCPAQSSSTHSSTTPNNALRRTAG